MNEALYLSSSFFLTIFKKTILVQIWEPVAILYFFFVPIMLKSHSISLNKTSDTKKKKKNLTCSILIASIITDTVFFALASL